MVIAAVRAALIYVVLVAALRVMGKRQLGDLQPSELVVTLLIADMAAVAMQDTASPLFSGLIPIAVLVSLELLISAAMLKLPFWNGCSADGRWCSSKTASWINKPCANCASPSTTC